MNHPRLESIFRCNDQSALIDNYVANQDPPPGAWSRKSEPQSALGRVSFPLVLTITRGEVYTRDARGKLVEQMSAWVESGFMRPRPRREPACSWRWRIRELPQIMQ